MRHPYNIKQWKRCRIKNIKQGKKKIKYYEIEFEELPDCKKIISFYFAQVNCCVQPEEILFADG
jgi:hypothetical protein